MDARESLLYALLLRWERFKIAVSETWLRLRGVKGQP
jgi:hypothetical protein